MYRKKNTTKMRNKNRYYSPSLSLSLFFHSFFLPSHLCLVHFHSVLSHLFYSLFGWMFRFVILKILFKFAFFRFYSSGSIGTNVAIVAVAVAVFCPFFFCTQEKNWMEFRVCVWTDTIMITIVLEKCFLLVF